MWAPYLLLLPEFGEIFPVVFIGCLCYQATDEKLDLFCLFGVSGCAKKKKKKKAGEWGSGAQQQMHAQSWNKLQGNVFLT